MIKSYRQYRNVPSFDDVMKQEQAKPIPSFDEVMGTDKKKVGSQNLSTSSNTSTNTNLLLGGNQNQKISIEDASKLIGGNQKQIDNQFQTTFNKPKKQIVSSKPLSNSEVEQEATNRLKDNLPFLFNGNDPIGNINNAIQASKDQLRQGTISSQADITQNENEGKIHDKMLEIANQNPFGDTKTASNFLYNQIKNQTGKDIPINQIGIDDITKILPQNASTQAAIQKVANNRYVSSLMNDSKDFNDFMDKYQNVSGKYSGLDLSKEEDKATAFQQTINDPDVIEAAKDNPKMWNGYLQERHDFNNKFPELAKQNLASKISQYREDEGKNNTLFNNPSKKDWDANVEKMFKEGKIDASDRAFYYQNIKPSDLKTTGFIESVGRGYEEGVRQIGKTIGLEDMGLLADKSKESQVNPTNNKIFGGGGHLMGNIIPMILTGSAFKDIGFGEKAANSFAAMLQFGGTNAEQAKKYYPNNPVGQFAYTTLGTTIDTMLMDLPIRAQAGIKQLLSGELKATVAKLSDNAIGDAVKEQVKQSFINKFIGASKRYGVDILKHNTQTAGVLTGIDLLHKGLNLGSGDKKAFEGTDLPKEFVDNFLIASPLSALSAAGALVGKQKSELNTAINKLPESVYTSPIKEALNKGDVPKLETYLKNVAEQLNNPQSSEITRKMFGEKLSDMVTKLYPNAKSEPINVEQPTNTTTPTTEQNRAEVRDTENEQAGVNTTDNGLQDGNSGSGKDVGGEKVGGSDVLNDAINRQKEIESINVNPSTLDGHSNFRELQKKRSEIFDVQARENLANDIGLPITYFDKLGWKQWRDLQKKLGWEDVNKDNYPELVQRAKNKFNDDVIAYEKYKQGNEIPISTEEKSNTIKEANTVEQPTSEEEKTSQPIENEPIRESNEGQPPSKEPPVGGWGEGIGITHAQTAEIRKEFGLDEYEKNPETIKKWDEEADQRIKEGKMPALLSKMEQGQEPDHVEQRMMGKYIAELSDRVEKEPSDANLAELKKAVELSDIVGGQKVGKSLVARKGTFLPDDSLAGFFVREMETEQVDTLTDAQKAKVKTEYENLQKAKADFDEYVANKEAELAKKQAETEIAKTKATAKRKAQKTHDDFVKERKEIVENLREKLKKARGETNVTVVPYAKELFTIAPEVGKLVRSLVEEGVVKLEDVIDNIHNQLKDLIPEIQKNDVRDLVAGVYNEKKKTQTEISATLRDLRDEAKLINKLEALLRGEEPKEERRKVDRNRQITELRAKIKEFQKEKANAEKEAKEGAKEKRTPEQIALSNIKKRIEKSIKDLEEQLRTGNFEKAQKKQIPLDAQGKVLKDKLIKLKQEREIRLMKIQYANRSRFEKARDATLEVLNVPRTIMSSMDFSAPLRQGIIAAISHPRTAGLAGIEMFRQSISAKRFDRWFYDLKNDPRYDLMQKSGLAVTDPHDYRLSAKEEAFMNNLAEKIPIVGKFIKGSERAYVGFLNKMRVDLFNRFAERFEEQGKTFDNSKELYEKLAGYINNQTGRGGLGKLENYAPILNTVFFSPRLIASRINLLNPAYYARLPKELRVMAAKDMLKFVGIGLTVLALAKLNGAQVEDDPRSSDFGKIKSGNTRWDIWGGFQQYVRLFAQMATGEKKSAITGSMKELNGEQAFGETRGDVLSRFFRGKLAPVPSMGVDFLSGRTVSGDNATVSSEAESHLMPLLYSDVKDAMKDKGISALFTVGIPSTFGVGVQTFLPKQKSPNSGGAGASGKFKTKTNKSHKPSFNK